MLAHLRPALVLLLIFTVLTGLVYPLVITGIAQTLFPSQANGSLIEKDGKFLGSKLIGQQFDDPKYFWGRLSATGPVAYTAFDGDKGTGSSGSNYGPMNTALSDASKARVDALRAADADNKNPVPVELATASGSGLDPHISPAAAEYQVPRIAKARGIPEDEVRKWVAQFTEDRTLGVLGEPRVNVLSLNLALDGMKK